MSFVDFSGSLPCVTFAYWQINATDWLMVDSTWRWSAVTSTSADWKRRCWPVVNSVVNWWLFYRWTRCLQSSSSCSTTSLSSTVPSPRRSMWV